MKNNNPIHPGCTNPSVKNGRKRGKQRYKCPDCGKTWTPDPQKAGRKPDGDRAMTDAERSRKYRKRQAEINRPPPKSPA